MAKILPEIGQRNGKKYILQHGRYAAGGRECGSLRWFLTLDGDYVGDFESKQEAYRYIDSEEVQ